jgi:hypothetical protein
MESVAAQKPYCAKSRSQRRIACTKYDATKETGMRRDTVWIAGIALILLQTMTLGQPAQGGFGGAVPGAGLPGGMEAAQPAEPAPKIESQLMPGEKFEDIQLSEVLTFMHEKLPEFNSVIVRSPGVDPNYPTLPQMSVKNVTIGQFLEFLKVSFPGVDIQRISGPAGPLYVVKVTAGPMDRPQFHAGMFPGAAAPPGGGFAPGGFAPMPGQPGQPQNVVQVYRLTDIVGSLLATRPADQGDPRPALADILSLVQSALEESGEKEKVVLKVHEQTQTLLFRGSMAKQAVLEQVLNTLRPAHDPQQTQQMNELRDTLRVLEAQGEIVEIRNNEAARAREKDMDELRTRLRETQKALEQAEMEKNLLQGQLDQARKQPR